MKLLKSTIVIVAFLMLGCDSKSGENASLSSINIIDRKFVDEGNNQIILHGINYVNKAAKIDTVNFSNPENFKLMKKWGFNCIRLGIIWAGVEPSPGVYDENFLKDIDYQIQLARDNDIYVYLDMHQDLYSQLYSDGAPEWATLTDGQPHVGDNVVWSEAYAKSPAVKTAITNFWNNKEAVDGVGIQDHYITMWKMLAKRYKGNPTIVGLDLMNEPNMGWGTEKGQELMALAYIQAYANKTGTILSGEEVISKWDSSDGRKEILEFISDPVIYGQVADAMFPVYSTFEKEHLMPFYEKTIKAIREVNQSELIFLETSMSSNMGVYTAIERVPGEENKLVYAPHGYDLVVDTPDRGNTNNNRINVIFNRHLETSKRLSMPLMIGEWGAFGINNKALESAMQVVRFLEASQSCDTYWSFNRDLDNSELLKAISRAYPQRIAGDLISYSTNVENVEAYFKWNETTTAESLIFIPKFYDLNERDIELSPEGKGFNLKEADGGWYVSIPSVSKERTLNIGQ